MTSSVDRKSQSLCLLRKQRGVTEHFFELLIQSYIYKKESLIVR